MRLRDLIHPSRVLLAVLGIAMLAAGCRSSHHRADDAKSGPEVIYARAQKAMKNSSFGEAIKQLEALQSRFPFSEPARQAQLDLIYAYYKNREVDPAIDAADTVTLPATVDSVPQPGAPAANASDKPPP